VIAGDVRRGDHRIEHANAGMHHRPEGARFRRRAACREAEERSRQNDCGDHARPASRGTGWNSDSFSHRISCEKFESRLVEMARVAADCAGTSAIDAKSGPIRLDPLAFDPS